jgi:hypothetical protein
VRRNPGWWPVLAAWALLGLALLAAAGLLAVFVVAGGVCWLALAAGWSLVRWHRRPSSYCRPPLPEPYRVADDLTRPLAEVVAAAEWEAATGELLLRGARKW